MKTEYTVERSISDIEFSERYVERRRKEIRKQLIDEGVTNPLDSEVERRLKEELTEVAQDKTLEAQGHNDLHLDIEIGWVKE
jgi:hypothetical protein